ncbi:MULTISPECIES: hypothetical protein [Paenibacillus]|nr:MULTISPECIES: hypothetical protein [Paenibacillus]MCF2945930.1 hypothetical protein [Paenibacillus tarimensis]
MRGLLMTLMLLVTVILIYTAVVEGESGTKAQVESSGRAMSESIRGISP